MRDIYLVEGGKILLIYSYEQMLYMRNIQGERVERAILLANDFLQNLSNVCFNNTLYYSYVNVKNDIIVKNILEHKVIYSIIQQESLECFSPVLEVVGEKIALFLLMRNPLNQKYVIKVIFFIEEKEFLLPEEYEKMPELQFMKNKKGICVFVAHDKMERVWSVQWKGNSCEIEQKQLQNKEAYKKALEENEANKQRFIEAEKRLKETEQRLEEADKRQKETDKRQKETERRLEETDKRLKEKEGIIQSIKRQYEELMETATRYREEAIKWREKYYAGKSTKKNS